MAKYRTTAAAAAAAEIDGNVEGIEGHQARH